MTEPNVPDFDILESFEDPGGCKMIFRWLKEDKEVHRTIFTFAEYLALPNTTICKSCLKWRGVLRAMTGTRTVSGHTLPTCPECHAIGYGTCTCKQVPHRIACEVGFYNYFPGEE